MRTYHLKPAVRLKPIPAAKHAADAACPDNADAPLSNKQKTRLAILARKAAGKVGFHGTKAEHDEWRHEISIRACGFRISEASQRHWADLKSTFQDLAGDSGGAFKTQMREGDNKRRIALHKLTEALRKKDLSPAYAATICRTQFKCSLEDASAKQLWCLFYTVTNRKK